MSQLILARSQHDFPVIDNDRLVGVVTRDDFLVALTWYGKNIAISAVMKKDLPEVDSYEMAENTLMRFQESGIPALPVTHAGQLVGIVTAENITEYLMIHSAIRASG
jgi:CBS domain-containing protein